MRLSFHSLFFLCPLTSYRVCVFTFIFVSQVVSPKTLLIETQAGATALKQATVTIRNTGSTVLFYSWYRVPRGETIVSVNGTTGGAINGRDAHLIKTEDGQEVTGVGSGVQGRGMPGNIQPRDISTSDTTSGKAAVAPSTAVDAAAARHAALRNPDGRFFCFQVWAARRSRNK